MSFTDEKCLLECVQIWVPRPQLWDTETEKRRGGEINNKRSMQPVGKGTVGRWRDEMKSPGIEEGCWQGVAEGRKGE